MCGLAFHVLIWRTVRQIRQQIDLDDLMRQIQHQAQEHVIHIRLEMHDQQFLAYDAHHGGFLAQGSDAAALVEAIKARVPDRTVLITQGEPDAIERFRASSETA